MKRKLGYSESIFYGLDINVTVLLKLTDRIDIDTAKLAAEKTFSIHPLSRSIIFTENDILYFRVNEGYYNFFTSEEDIESVLFDETHHSFPENSNLARVTYVINSESYYIVFCFSHTISDGRAVLNFISDFFNFYQNMGFLPLESVGFPPSIENCSNIENQETQCERKNSDNKSINQKHIFLSIDHEGKLFKLLNFSSSTSMTASLAAIFLKAFGDAINDVTPDLYLTLDLRNVLKIEQNSVAFYSVGIADNYNIEQSLADLSREIQVNLMAVMTNAEFQKKALSHTFGTANDLHFSYIHNAVIKKIEQNSLIDDIKFIGNACLPDSDRKQAFILVVNFRKKLNITLCYDERVVSNTVCCTLLSHIEALFKNFLSGTNK